MTYRSDLYCTDDTMMVLVKPFLGIQVAGGCPMHGWEYPQFMDILFTFFRVSSKMANGSTIINKGVMDDKKPFPSFVNGD